MKKMKYTIKIEVKGSLDSSFLKGKTSRESIYKVDIHMVEKQITFDGRNQTR